MYTKTESFRWDRRKAHTNAVKHGIRFEEAALAFDDPYALVLDALEHSTHEIRQWLIGDSGFDVLVVVFTPRPPGFGVRIISARRAGRREKRGYEESKRV
ncbi:MAG: hypothetical protein A2V88_05255 [Elusimicrobia bacterium RBG_16_66_12]|nr:MAG: hypothetical protein A2V88_05255 [Elusimicrobia bacterium RBG_16_66_12]